MEQNTCAREKVKHSRFGEGEITSIKGDKIKVVFGGLVVKEFSYPQSFNDGTLIKMPTHNPIPPSMNSNFHQKGTKLIKIGTTIEAKTHAEFLNELLGTNYKNFMQSGKTIQDGRRLWMIELGPFVSPAGWKNQLILNDLIIETHVGIKFEFSKHDTYKHALLTGIKFDDSDRVIFDIVKKETHREYIFRGVFRLNKTKSSLKENVWDLIMSEYNI